jgi:predicted CopG family antitoxin
MPQIEISEEAYKLLLRIADEEREDLGKLVERLIQKENWERRILEVL